MTAESRLDLVIKTESPPQTSTPPKTDPPSGDSPSNEPLSTALTSTDPPITYQERPIVYAGKELPKNENFASVTLPVSLCHIFQKFGGCPNVKSCADNHLAGFKKAIFSRTVFIQAWDRKNHLGADSLMEEVEKSGDTTDFEQTFTRRASITLAHQLISGQLFSAFPTLRPKRTPPAMNSALMHMMVSVLVLSPFTWTGLRNAVLFLGMEELWMYRRACNALYEGNDGEAGA
ncbi:hypothetical protein HK097_006724 [Rhizophlyctis rosea]|uniref:Uncharacterized protein n=1 Tax=Rhizophlyctis rosea TaxID=64517 RepID=A0AAD5SDZ1_9FUNG|nr:hypothetical protein HK097_006724 [Rhizophlyctis rosea]